MCVKIDGQVSLCVSCHQAWYCKRLLSPHGSMWLVLCASVAYGHTVLLPLCIPGGTAHLPLSIISHLMSILLHTCRCQRWTRDLRSRGGPPPRRRPDVPAAAAAAPA